MENYLKRKKVVNLVHGLNKYYKKMTIPVIGKLPSKKVESGEIYSEWGLIIGLLNCRIDKVPVKDFNINDYEFVIVDCNTKFKGLDY